jgi:hypothetical protein
MVCLIVCAGELYLQSDSQGNFMTGTIPALPTSLREFFGCRVPLSVFLLPSALTNNLLDCFSVSQRHFGSMAIVLHVLTLVHPLFVIAKPRVVTPPIRLVAPYDRDSKQFSSKAKRIIHSLI